MPFNFNFKSVVLLLLATHIVLIALVMLLRGLKEQERSSRWLAFLLLLSVLYIFPYMTGYAGWYSLEETRLFLFYFPCQQPLLMAPALYFYFRTLMHDRVTGHERMIFHFMPGILYIVYTIVMYLNDAWISDSFQFYGDGRDRDFDFWHQAAGFLSLVVYAILSLRLYRKYVATIQDTLSYADAIMLRWARNFVVTLLLLLTLRLTFFITNPEWNNFGKKFWYYVCFGGIMYYLALRGLIHAIRAESFLRPAPEHEPTPSLPQTIDPAEAVAIQNKIIALLSQEHLYKNPRLTIADLAKAAGVPVKRLSPAIHQKFNTNFNDLINLYRINDLLARIDRGELSNRTILGLAEEAGFNSKTTFNRVFKKIVKLNPREYAQLSKERRTKP